MQAETELTRKGTDERVMMKSFFRIICIMLAVCGLLSLTSCKNSGGKTSGGETNGNKTGTYQATEGLFVYYVYSAAADFSEEEIAAHNFDASKSLKDQMYDSENTWYDILMINARESLNYLLTYCNAAAEEGVSLDDSDNAAIEQLLLDRRINAAANGYTLDDYLAMTYNNSYITEAVLKYAYQLQYLSSKYSKILEDRFTASLTEAMINEQLAAGGNTDTTLTRDIGIMVFTTEKYGSSKGAVTQAENILNSLKENGPLTAGAFESSAKANSESNEIFFYNVADGDMSSDIDEWLYGGAAKNIGDAGVVSTDYGACIVYYESDGDPLNVAAAKVELVKKMFDEWYSSNKNVYANGITDDMIKGLKLDF